VVPGVRIEILNIKPNIKIVCEEKVKSTWLLVWFRGINFYLPIYLGSTHVRAWNSF
jgi:hypothetical protein